MPTFDRKVIRITALESPNVREGERLRREYPSMPLSEVFARSTLFDGLLTYQHYLSHRRNWDAMRQAAGLDAVFYEGPGIKLFPSEWLDNAARLAERIQWNRVNRNCLGVDAAEGGDNTSWAVVNQQGCPFMRSKKTKDTSDIPGETLAVMREWNVRPEDVCFDRGGGGKQHADQLRRRGYPVRTVAFGERLMLEPKRGIRTFGERKEVVEDRYVYKNRRAEMYYELAANKEFAIAAEILWRKRTDGGPSLGDQLARFPRLIDDDGRYWLPSKGIMTDEMEKQGVKTLTQLIGCSPDEADGLVIGHWTLRNPQRRMQAGAA